MPLHMDTILRHAKFEEYLSKLVQFVFGSRELINVQGVIGSIGINDVWVWEGQGWISLFVQELFS